MSDSEDEQYIYSDEEDGDGDAFMAESPSAKKARDETHPARVEDGAYVLMGADDVAKMMLAKVKQISELLDVPRDCAEVLLREKGWWCPNIWCMETRVHRPGEYCNNIRNEGPHWADPRWYRENRVSQESRDQNNQGCGRK